MFLGESMVNPGLVHGIFWVHPGFHCSPTVVPGLIHGGARVDPGFSSFQGSSMVESGLFHGSAASRVDPWCCQGCSKIQQLPGLSHGGARVVPGFSSFQGSSMVNLIVHDLAHSVPFADSLTSAKVLDMADVAGIFIKFRELPPNSVEYFALKEDGTSSCHYSFCNSLPFGTNITHVH